MKINFIPKFITLLAGAIVCIISIVNDMDTTYSLEILLATLVIFYLIGSIAKVLIQKVLEGNMFVKQQAISSLDMPLPLDENRQETEDTEQAPVQNGDVENEEE